MVPRVAGGAVVLVLLISLSTCLFGPRTLDSTVDEFLALKKESRIARIKIRDDVLTADLRGPYEKNGKSYGRIRFRIPSTYLEFPTALEKLYANMPSGTVDVPR